MSRRSKKGGFIIGPILILGAILALWENEGRFDYYRAAKKAQVLSQPIDGNSAHTVGFTGDLGPLAIGGNYIEKIPGYLQIIERAEIYSWERREDDDGVRWSKGWHTHLQRNSRNNGLQKTLNGASWVAEEYAVGDFLVDGDRLHFVDASVRIPSRNVRLNTDGKQSGLVPQGNIFYKRNPKPGAGQLGDERLTVLGIPAEKTVSYFGLVQDGRAVGKQVEVKSGFISKIIQDDGILHHLVNGNRDSALAAMKSHIQKVRWMVRLIGTAAIVFGQLIFLGQLVHLLVAIPILGRLVGAGIFLFSLVMGIIISASVMVLSMIFHNLIVAMVVVGGLIAIWAYLSRAQKRSSEKAQDYLKRSPISQLPADVPTLGGSANDLVQSDQLHKVFKNLVKISLSDGELSKEENNFLAEWARSRGISDEMIVNLFDEAKKTKDEELEATSYDDLHHLITLSMLDGTMSTQELRHITDFGRKLGMNQQQIHTTIKKATIGELGMPAVG